MSKSIETIFDSSVQEYWLVFTQGSNFVSHFLKKNYSHVYVITRDRHNWMILNPLRLCMIVQIAAFPVTDDLPRLIRLPQDRILKVTMHRRKADRVFGYFGLFNCVTIVRYLIGLRMNVLTPFRLYKRLIHLTPTQLARHGIQAVKQIA